MNPFGGSGGDNFFSGGGGDFFGGGMGRGGPMGGPMGGGMGRPMGGMGRGGPMSGMGGMGGGNPRQGGYSSFSSYDSSRPEGQQYQERHEPFGDYAGGGGGGSASHEPTPCGGGGGRGFMFSGLTRADNPFRRQVGRNLAGGYNPSAQEEPRYQHTGQMNPQYTLG
jgi:hypothetical protein